MKSTFLFLAFIIVLSACKDDDVVPTTDLGPSAAGRYSYSGQIRKIDDGGFLGRLTGTLELKANDLNITILSVSGEEINLADVLDTPDGTVFNISNKDFIDQNGDEFTLIGVPIFSYLSDSYHAEYNLEQDCFKMVYDHIYIDESLTSSNRRHELFAEKIN